MNPKVAKWIAMAAEIDASDRPSTLTQRIDQLTAESGGAWSVDVLRSLHNQLLSEYSRLKNTYSGSVTDSPQMAWRARNLLEICVWCIYCCKSETNARRFYEDAGRDVLGLLDAFTKWGTATGRGQNWADSIRSQQQVVSQRAASVGISPLSGSYKEVREAAKDVGIEDAFRVVFRMLSKFAHPTAMQILGKTTAENISVRVSFVGGFTELENRVLRVRIR